MMHSRPHEQTAELLQKMDPTQRKIAEDARAEFIDTRNESIEVVRRARSGSMCHLHQPSNFELMLATPAATAFITKVGTFNKGEVFFLFLKSVLAFIV